MKSAGYWTGYFDARKSATYELIDLIVDIQNDALHGVSSTPDTSKSSTPTQEKPSDAETLTKNRARLAWDPELEYTIYWNDQTSAFTGEAPNCNNYPSEQAETKAVGALFVLGFIPTEKMVWISNGFNRWVLIPRTLFDDNNQFNNPQLAVAYS